MITSINVKMYYTIRLGSQTIESVMAQDLSLYLHLQTVFGDHPASYSAGTRHTIKSIKWPEPWDSPPSSTVDV